jgi:glycine cleavage system H protein
VNAKSAPVDLKYSKSHEWVRLESGPGGQKIATVGITAFALQALTDLVFVDLPAVGRDVHAGESFGEIESVKAVSDLNSPVDGRVVEVNTSLASNLAHLAEDPYGGGWFVKIAVSGEGGLSDLMDATAYQKQCEEESAE